MAQKTTLSPTATPGRTYSFAAKDAAVALKLDVALTLATPYNIALTLATPYNVALTLATKG